jgi:hypothetical protein
MQSLTSLNSKNLIPSQTLEARKRNFVDYLASMEISDMQVLPSSDLTRLFIRITRYSNSQGPLPLDSVLSNLCEYMWTSNCGPKLMKGVKKVTLDGDEVRDDDGGVETTTGAKEVYTVDTYEVMIDNK